MILLTIFILFVEALFFYISLKQIKDIEGIKNEIKLYLGIFISNIISTLVFNSSIFRYILYLILIFFVLKNIDKKTRLYDFFIISFLLGFKLFIEFLIATLFHNNLSSLYTIFVLMMEILCILFAIITRKPLKQIYKKIINYWDCNKKFYLRYFMLITFNSLILFFIHNLIKISEVS